MHANTEGCSPSLRPQLGVGWNRALPGAFQFATGILPDGVNDSIDVKAMEGQAMPSKMSMCMWVRTPATWNTTYGCLLLSSFNGVAGVEFGFDLLLNGSFRSYYKDTGGPVNQTVGSLPANSLCQIAMCFDFVTKQMTGWINGVRQGTVTGTWTGVYNANVIQKSGLFRLAGTANIWPYKIDEAALFNRILTDNEVMINYNAGAGLNLSQTEGLIWWYKFEQGESDTDLNPGGNPTGWTAGTWGVRDQSPNGNHGMQTGMANNATFGGTIQTF